LALVLQKKKKKKKTIGFRIKGLFSHGSAVVVSGPVASGLRRGGRGGSEDSACGSSFRKAS
jgi:hypothetical protein